MANNDGRTTSAGQMNTMSSDKVDGPSLYIRAPPTIVRGLLDSPYVTIIVVDNGVTKKYELNRANICAKSDYFQAAFLKSRMQESQTREITLEDGVSHKTMGIFVNWLQSGLVYLDEGSKEVAGTGASKKRSRKGSSRSLPRTLIAGTHQANSLYQILQRTNLPPSERSLTILLQSLLQVR